MARYNYDKYRSGSSTEEQPKSSGRYNYEKYASPAPAPVNRDTSALVSAMQSGSAPSMDVRRSPIAQEAAALPPTPSFGERVGQAIKGAYGNVRSDPVLGVPVKAAETVARGLHQQADTVAKDPGFAGLGEVSRPFITPGASPAAVQGVYQGAGQLVQRLTPGLASSTGGRAVQKAATEAITGFPLGVGQALTHQTSDLGEAAKEGVQGAAVGVGLGSAASLLGDVLRRYRPSTPEPGPVLALPEPRQRGNINTAQTPDVIPGQPGPIGLPEPNIAPPTTARSATVERVNPYRQQYDALVEAAQELNVPPDSLRSIYRQIADETDPKTLDELIDLAYPRSRVTPDLVQRARSYQASREVAGAPLPVRTMSDRYPQGDVRGAAAAPITVPARRGTTTSVQPGVDIVPPRRRFPEQDAPSSSAPVSRSSSSGTGQTIPNERRFIQSMRSTGALADEVDTGLASSPQRTYRPITNEGTMSAAERNLDRSGLDSVVGTLTSPATRLTPQRVAEGVRVLERLQAQGQYDRAVSVAEQMAKKLTEAGQTVQAARMIDYLTPEGAQIFAQRKVAAINKELSKGATDVKITPKMSQDIAQAAQALQRGRVSEQRAGEVLQLMDQAAAGRSLTAEELQTVRSFVEDARQYTVQKPRTGGQTPRPARQPKEMQEPRIRDRVTAYADRIEQEALERIRSRGNRLSSTPLDEYADYVAIGAARLARGTVKFADWSESMVRDFGEQIRPQLANIYERAKQTLSQDVKRISGETISQAERIAENYIKKHDATMRPEDVQLIRDLAKNVSELSGTARTQASQDLQAVLNGLERAGIGRKIATTQYIAMLLNPVTQMRNIVGNEIMYRLDRMSRIMATPIDWAASKMTGSERQITFSGRGWQDFFAPTKNYWDGLVKGARAGWRGVSPEGLTTSYDIQGNTFGTKLKPIMYLERTLGAVMKGFDYAAYNRAVQQRLRETARLDAINKGIKGREEISKHIDTYMANLDNNIADVAREYGKYITLQDTTALSKALSSFQRGLNYLSTGTLSKNYGAGSIMLPFARTPANLLMRAIDFSPAGFGKAILQTAQIMRQRDVDLTRADVIQSVTRAILGSGLTGVGLWLANLGVLRGESHSDRDVRELERQSGLTQYQINGSALQRVMGAMITGNMEDVRDAAKIKSGDTMWQYEWAQPTSVPLALGANIYQDRRKAQQDVAKGKEPESGLARTIDVTLGAGNTLLNTSVLQGIQEAFSIPPGEDNKLKAVTTNLIKQIPSMFTPSIVNQINRSFDPAIRETYDPNFLDRTLNPAQSRVPFLAQRLPQRVDTLGQPIERPTNVFDVFLSPAQRSEFKPSAEAKFVMDLLSETGDERIAPRAVPRYITGTDPKTRTNKRVELTGEQLTQYQTIVGQETVKRIGRISPNATTESKVKQVLKALNDAGEIGRREMRKELGLR